MTLLKKNWTWFDRNQGPRGSIARSWTHAWFSIEVLQGVGPGADERAASLHQTPPGSKDSGPGSYRFVALGQFTSPSNLCFTIHETHILVFPAWCKFIFPNDPRAMALLNNSRTLAPPAPSNLECRLWRLLSRLRFRPIKSVIRLFYTRGHDNMILVRLNKISTSCTSCTLRTKPEKPSQIRRSALCTRAQGVW